MKKTMRSLVLAGSGILSALATLERAGAATLYATGFEPSGSSAYPSDNYGANQLLYGQDGWSGAVAGSQYPVAGVYNYATAFGSNANPSNVQFAALVDSTIGAGSVGYYTPPVSYTPTLVSGEIVDIIFQLGVPQANQGSPFFGVVAFNGSNPIAGVGVDGANGQLSIIGNSAALTGNPTFNGGTNPGLSSFYNYEIQLDYIRGTFSIYGAPLTSTSFTSANLVDTGTFVGSTLTDVALTSYSLDTSTPATGNGYFDNLSVSAAVPEPGSVSLILCGTLIATLKRSRRAGN